MPRYVHYFLRLPLPMMFMVNGVHMTISNIETIGLSFVPQFVLTESIDPPFTEAKRRSPSACHHVHMGHDTEEKFLEFCGIQQPVTVAVHDALVPYTPKIESDLAFLAALEHAMTQYGTAMPIELHALLFSFITAEKDRRGIPSP